MGGLLHDDAGLARRLRQRMREVGNAHRVDRHVGVAVDLRVDRHEVVVSVILHAAAREIDERLHVRTGGRRLVEKIAERRAQGLAVEITRPDHVKPRRLQSLCDESGVVGGRRQRRVPIGCIADDESNAGILRRLLRARG